MKTLHREFKNILIKITELLKKINKNDKQKILQMMKEHSEEIEEQYNNQNEHGAIETADLIVLCYEFLMMENRVIDEVFLRCLPRFDMKLRRLVKNVSYF